jgi:predicted permease
LLSGAGLLMRSFVKLVNADWGFDSAHVLTAFLSFPPRQVTSVEDQHRIYREIVDRAAAVPGVRAVSGCTNGQSPLGGFQTSAEVPGVAIQPTAPTLVLFCTERVLETMGIPLRKGRTLSAVDVEQGRQVAVVNETLVKRYFGSDDPLGHVVRLAGLAALPRPVADPTFQIVGVMGDIANLGPRDAPAPQAIVPLTLRLPSGMTLGVRTLDDPMRIVNALRREIQIADARAAVATPARLEDVIQITFYARPRFSLLVLGIFALTGIFLVALGVYGVLSYTVSQQTREIALRLALGGETSHVMRMVLRFGLQLVGAGLVIGLAVSLATNRLLVDQLWHTSPTDPLALGAVIALVVAIGTSACWIPARRAIRVEPMIALRHE